MEINEALDVLGLNRNSSYQEAKRAYKTLIGMFHPDKIGRLNGRPKKEAENKAKEINVAWKLVKEHLNDPNTYRESNTYQQSSGNTGKQSKSEDSSTGRTYQSKSNANYTKSDQAKSNKNRYSEKGYSSYKAESNKNETKIKSGIPDEVVGFFVIIFMVFLMKQCVAVFQTNDKNVTEQTRSLSGKEDIDLNKLLEEMELQNLLDANNQKQNSEDKIVDVVITERVKKNESIADDSQSIIINEGRKVKQIKTDGLGYSRETVFNVQSKLKQLGFYNYKVDGLFGEITEKAIIDFQRKQNITVTGMIDQTLLNHLNKVNDLSSDTTTITKRKLGKSDTSHLSGFERQAIEKTCSYHKNYSRPAKYYSCVEDEVQALRSSGRLPDTSHLSGFERQAIEKTCSYHKNYSGPAKYYSCVEDEVQALKNPY